MKINPLGVSAYTKIQSLDTPTISPTPQSPEGGKGFGQVLETAIRDVDGLQKTADQQVENMVLGKANAPHEAMIALEKADAAFQLMNQVRSKIIRAYEEVMRTQV